MVSSYYTLNGTYQLTVLCNSDKLWVLGLVLDQNSVCMRACSIMNVYMNVCFYIVCVVCVFIKILSCILLIKYVNCFLSNIKRR